MNLGLLQTKVVKFSETLSKCYLPIDEFSSFSVLSCLGLYDTLLLCLDASSPDAFIDTSFHLSTLQRIILPRVKISFSPSLPYPFLGDLWATLVKLNHGLVMIPKLYL